MFLGFDDVYLAPSQVDKSSGNQTRLLEVTRRLTGGLVSGRSSHLDAFENRYIYRAELAARNAIPRLAPQDAIFPLLPAIAHEAATLRLTGLASLRASLSAPIPVAPEPVWPLPLGPAQPMLEEPPCTPVAQLPGK